MKRFICILTMMIVLAMGTCQAATYTLPEKMYNQLAIGSGLKGSFYLTAEGEKFRTPFLDAVTDAEWMLRGIRSGEDLHYYLFQSNEQEEQSACTELYKKDGVYYLRSDMVQGKILAFPVLSQVLDSLFPAGGENGSSSSFVSKILQLPESTRKEQWDPVLLKYQNELEMWLADFALNAPVVKMKNGLSALDFTYEIPIESLFAQIGKLYGELAADAEMTALLDKVMSEEEKTVYMNGNLVWYYLDALKSLALSEPVRITKRVSATGEMIRFGMELPLDEKASGYRNLRIETVNELTVYTLQSTQETIVLALPDIAKLKQTAFEQSIWYSRIKNEDPEKKNVSLRIDIRRTNEVSDREEKTVENVTYHISVARDDTYLPEGIIAELIPEYEAMEIDVDMDYSSKYAQNSATTLEIKAEVRQGESRLQLSGKMKTAAPWLFMPFEVVDPIQAGTGSEVFDSFMTDWISNAASIVRHGKAAEEATAAPAEDMAPADNGATENEAPEKTEDETAPEHTDADAEASPMDIAEQE